MKLILKIITTIKTRGFFIVFRQVIAYILLRFTPIALLSKGLFLLTTFVLLGYWPNIKNPKTFNEKILHRREFIRDPRASLVADKCLARQYIKDRGFEEILNEMYYVTDIPDSINFEKLPQRFVIKANYGSNKNIIVNNKNRINTRKILSTCNYWIKEQHNILRRTPEIHYRDIKPLIIIEKNLNSFKNNSLIDYKFWCFDGNVEFINVQFILNGVRLTMMFDKYWNFQPFSTSNKPMFSQIKKKPENLDKMIQIAEKLSAGFNFLRVDLYCLKNNKIIFGELTYNPGGGAAIFIPRKYDFELGKLLEL